MTDCLNSRLASGASGKLEFSSQKLWEVVGICRASENAIMRGFAFSIRFRSRPAEASPVCPGSLRRAGGEFLFVEEGVGGIYILQITLLSLRFNYQLAMIHN